MTATSARLAALDVVTRVRERGAYAHESMDTVLRGASLSERDRAFATRLAYETISSRGTLDEAIKRYVKDPASLEPAVADALAVAACDLLLLSTPARAAVSQGVDLVKSVRPAASRLANAVLRRLSEDVESFPWGDPETDGAALARLYRHPQWLADMWVSELGRDTAVEIMRANNEPAPLYLAAIGSTEEVVQLLADDGVVVTPGPLPHSLIAEKPAAAVHSAAVESRRAVIADAGAQFAAASVPLGSGTTVLDVGAGRGTKTLLMASVARTAGLDVRIVAVDTHDFKLGQLRADAESLGLGPIETVVADATEEMGSHLPDAAYDAVLVDAPCSGLGTLRRHPDRRWRATADEIDTLATIGSKLLARASVIVKPGGFVVYSTCTIARRENRHVIEEFLGSPEGKHFTIDSLAGDVPAEWAGFVDSEGLFQSLPTPHGVDGHFVARLRRDDA